MNRLAGETSPYLLQHRGNPVDWYPWGDEVFEVARAKDRPVFLSIGYAACHWCHVMERESFEDDGTAQLLNREFVSVKVDREERPDVDEIYMSAVQMMTGHGGWPLSVFLTPDRRPFFGGTYFPPEDRAGLAGFPTVLRRVSEAWRERRDRVDASADELTGQLQRLGRLVGAEPGSSERLGDLLPAALVQLRSGFDPRWGGFGAAPKFPPDASIALALDQHAKSGDPIALEMARTTLRRMATGGIYDHVGGGFCRYSTDERWLVPHFEKMLYNQALLVQVYVDAWLVTGEPLFRRVVEQTLDFVYRELSHADGGFYSSLDADSDGAEGRYYVWTPEQVAGTLSRSDASRFCAAYDITAAGNFEGAGIPNLIDGDASSAPALDPQRTALLAQREGRNRPATDDKVLTAWNGMMIGAAARAYRAFGRPRDLERGERAARFADERLRNGNRLSVTWRDGSARLDGYLDDYAFLGRGLLELYEAGFETVWLERAAELARAIVERFRDPERGAFFFTAHDHEPLIARTHSLHDGALPAGSAVAIELLARVSWHVDDQSLREAARDAVRALRPAVERMPSAYASLLLAADLLENPPGEIAIVGRPGAADVERLIATVRRRYRRGPAVQVGLPSGAGDPRAILRDKTTDDGRAVAFVCREYSCRAPTSDAQELARQLGDV